MHDKMKPARKRGNPTAQVGNYAAEVDTAGMDPEMKRTMGVAKKRKRPGFRDLINKLRGKQ